MEEQKKTDSVWKRLLLPTLLTIAIGSIYARSRLLVGSGWQMVSWASVELDGRPSSRMDDAAKLGVSPYYFVNYNSSDGQEHWIPPANRKGSSTARADLPTVDPAKSPVRFLVVMKNHHRISLDETRNRVVDGVGVNEGKSMKFKALSLPRGGDFHPSDVERIELETTAKR